MNSVSTLPTNLCLRPTGHSPRGRYGVWSLKDIPVGTRFGPYRGLLIDVTERDKNKDFQWQVETKERKIIILDGSNERHSNWLRYVNYASIREEQNLIPIQRKSDVYYVTSKAIPANVELLVWYEGGIDNEERTSDRKGCNRQSMKNAENVETNSLQDHGEKKRNHKIKILEAKTDIDVELQKDLDFFSGLNLQTQSHMRKTSYTYNGRGNKFNFRGNNTIYIDKTPYECNECGKKITLDENLKKHKNTRNGSMRYDCNICGKKFLSMRNFVVHKRSHTGEKSYKCDIYGKKFIIRAHFNEHNRVHTGKKPYECNIRRKKFIQVGNLNRHENVHTNEKQYECDICGKKFVYRSNLNSCNKIHTGEKSIECNICGNKFTGKGDFKMHNRIHTSEQQPYECKVCETKFTLRHHLTLREMIHIGKKPYECGESEDIWKVITDYLMNVVNVEKNLLNVGT